MVGVILIEKVAFEPRLNKGKRVSLAHIRGKAVQAERAAKAVPSDGSSLIIRRHSKEARWLELKVRAMCWFCGEVMGESYHLEPFKDLGFALDCNGELMQGSEQGRLWWV